MTERENQVINNLFTEETEVFIRSSLTTRKHHLSIRLEQVLIHSSLRHTKIIT